MAGETFCLTNTTFDSLCVFIKSVNVVFKVRGLCGTLTWTQRDDFTTPEGDVENSVSSFAGKFTTEQCSMPGGPLPDACTTFTQRRQYAETVCSVIHSAVFQVCSVSLSFSVTVPFFSHAPPLSGSLGVSRRGGEGTLLSSLSVRGLWLCSSEGVSLHHHHCLCPTLCSGRRRCTLA